MTKQRMIQVDTRALPADAARWETAAQRDGRSRSNWIRRALNQAADAAEKDQPATQKSTSS
jgi:hypothetical protein